MRTRRTNAWIAVGAIALAACGASAPESDGAPTDTPTSVTSTPAATTGVPAPVATEAVPPPTSGVLPTDAPIEPTTAPASESPVESPVESTAEPAGMVWPDESCSADNSATPTEAADGPAPALEVRSESVGSPLPDLAVRRINCGGGWVNLRNELPSDRALLIWMWAPH